MPLICYLIKQNLSLRCQITPIRYLFFTERKYYENGKTKVINGRVLKIIS